MPAHTTTASIAILNPVVEQLRAGGFEVGQVKGGKPWGSGCPVGSSRCRVSVFFYPVPNQEKNRWEGSIHIIPAPPLWRALFGLRDRTAEERMTNLVADSLKEILPKHAQFLGVRWMPLQELCASKGYKD
ncbi:hypothetical protein DB347_25145 [Opitutaceae bacterium EW11]|nr:hypothetical protein DB347_25145 [Opitutaceae bacterium EW11]